MTDQTSAAAQASPVVGVIMGSSSDWEVMKHAVTMLEDFGVAYEARVISAHRMPQDMAEYGAAARQRGLRGIIAGAGGAAHLPGMAAAMTHLPVLGVPVATFAIGEAGAANAALHVIATLAGTDAGLHAKLLAFRARQTQAARDMKVPPEA